MSTICITHHNECIYDIVKQPCQIVDDGSGRCTYVSRYRPKVLKEERKAKECHRTFGYAKVPLPKPCQFLRKYCRIVPPRPKRDLPSKPKCLAQFKKPCLPSCRVVKKEPEPCPCKAWEDAWKKGKGKRYIIACKPKPKVCPKGKGKAKETTKEEKSKMPKDKNFILQNVIKVKCSCPRQPVPRYVDTAKGDVHLLVPSGLLHCFSRGPCFGKVPAYLACMPRKCKAAPMQLSSPCDVTISHFIPECERSQLLQGLRHNWCELTKAYQSLPILSDTIFKRMRKERLERELMQLEHDIRLLERHKYIYVVEENTY